MQSVSNITIAIPVYDRYEFFEEALNSAINQTITCQIIVVDNCSPHNKFKEYVDKINIHNLTYYRNDINYGAIGNWNKCIDYCCTDWISILHSDDMLSPHYVESICKIINNNSEDYVFIVGNEVGDRPNKIYKKQETIRYGARIKAQFFLLGNYAGFPGNIYNKSKIQLKFEELKGASDYYFWYSMAKVKPLLVVNNVLAFYRKSSSQDSASMNIEEVVIKPVYTVRKYKIGFKNRFVKLISMYELFDLYRYYQKSYNRVEESDFKFSVEEINYYFTVFNRKFFKIAVYPLYKITRYSLRNFF